MCNPNKDFINTLRAGFRLYNYNIPDKQIGKLSSFNSMVMEVNKHTNLTAIEDGAESAQKHFLDSLNPVALSILGNAKHIIDIGSGAGFPGIPLAILKSDVRFTLVDTRKKRCEFMESVKSYLGLNNVNVIWNRAEELGKDEKYREKYDIACARALAAMPTLLEYLAPFVKVGGITMFYKGHSPQEEVALAKNAATILGIDNFNISPYTILDKTPSLAMVYGEKTRATPSKYPRKSGLASKRPL